MAAEVHRDECRHFNGIQHDTCKAGVRYDAVRDESARPYRFPCLDTGKGCPDTCTARSLLTQEEHAEKEREMRAAVARMLDLHAVGKCHLCEAPIEPSKVVGHCLYASCGHRLGQTSQSEGTPE